MWEERTVSPMMSKALNRSLVGRVLAVATLVALLGLLVAPAPASAGVRVPSVVAAWTIEDYPQGVAADGEGNVYVALGVLPKVLKLGPTGAVIDTIGSLGSGPGQFSHPNGVAVDSDDHLYVTDEWDSRVQEFDADGNFVSEWGTDGSEPGAFSEPLGIAVGPDGSVYVADSQNFRVQKFTSDGEFVLAWGEAGSGDGQFQSLNGPTNVAVDPTGGLVYVTDVGNDRVQVFTPSGAFVRAWGSRGTARGEFQNPVGVAVDGDGYVYVAEAFGDRVQKFTSTGTFVVEWGSTGTGVGQFDSPRGIAADVGGRVVVADHDNERVQVFRNVARPDGRIRRGTSVTVGNNIYNVTGRDQKVTGSAVRGGTVTYYATVENEAPFAEALRLRGGASSANYVVKYRQPDGTNITTEVVNGTYRTPALEPKGTFQVTITVKVGARAPVGSSLSALLTAISSTDGAERDAVKFVTRRA